MTSKRPPSSFYLTDRHSVNDQLTQNSSHLRHPPCLGQPCLVSRYNRTELPVPQPRHSGRGEEHLICSLCSGHSHRPSVKPRDGGKHWSQGGELSRKNRLQQRVQVLNGSSYCYPTFRLSHPRRGRREIPPPRTEAYPRTAALYEVFTP